MIDLAHAEEVLTEALAVVRALRAESMPLPSGIESDVAERVRVGGLYADAEGCLTCERTAQALGRTASGLRWHCTNGSGPPQRPARRGHKHKLTDAIEWEKRQG